MSKDPAALLYIDAWLTSTADMATKARAWYMDLLLHNYDKKSLPNDIETLAVLCRVKHSEFEEFEHVFKHVLKHKFEQNPDGTLSNPVADEIIKGREQFKEQRSNSGKLSYFLRYCKKKHAKELTTGLVWFIKENVDFSTLDTKSEHMLEHVFKQNFELYRNKDENKDKDDNKPDPEKKEIVKTDWDILIGEWLLYKKNRKETYRTEESKQKFVTHLKNLSKNNIATARKIIDQSMANNWAGVFELKATDQTPAPNLKKKDFEYPAGVSSQRKDFTE